jgi:hypothetical protein
LVLINYLLQFITTNLKTGKINHDRPVIGGVYGDPFRWEAPPGMVLLGFNVRTGDFIDQMAPIWGASPPLSYEITVTKVDYPDKLPTKEVPLTDMVRGTIRNATKDNMSVTVKWNYKTETESSFSVLDSQTKTSGFKSTAEVSVEAKAFGVGGTGASKLNTEFSLVEISKK